MLLVGLLVQAGSRDVFEVLVDFDAQVGRADKLLEEFHRALERPMRDAIESAFTSAERRQEFQEPLGDSAKEAIFYGAQSAFSFQYKRFARNRYRNDGDWLLANRGISIRPIIE